MTVAEIADKAFDSVASKISGVVKNCVLVRSTSNYDVNTGETVTTTNNYNCRVIFGDRSAIKDYFEESIIGEGSRLVYIEGLEVSPIKTDKIQVSGLELTLEAVLDVAQASGFYVVVTK